MHTVKCAKRSAWSGSSRSLNDSINAHRCVPDPVPQPQGRVLFYPSYLLAMLDLTFSSPQIVSPIRFSFFFTHFVWFYYTAKTRNNDWHGVDATYVVVSPCEKRQIAQRHTNTVLIFFWHRYAHLLVNCQLLPGPICTRPIIFFRLKYFIGLCRWVLMIMRRISHALIGRLC